MENQLFFLHHGFRVEIYAFVLMSNHFHLILRCPDGNLSQAMQFFMVSTSRELQKLGGRINQIWGTRFFRCRLNSQWSFFNCYKYVYRNPVTAGICNNVEEYPYSTLQGLLGNSRIYIPLVEDTLLFENTEKNLRWLNTKPTDTALDSIRKALKHSDFKMPNINDRKNPWDKDLI